MDKSKLRPATPADLVEGNKIIVEDAIGAFVNGTVIQALDANVGKVYVHGTHTYGSGKIEDVEEDYGWPFMHSDFEDGRHGDYGLKLWVETLAAEDEAPEWSDEVFERAEIRKGDEVIRPASGTLTKGEA